ncbi:MAG: peptide chain release factor N(5)-glutamine methyltransferase [Candidatus Krumholzibacteriota bacterium]|nr:peptide chain release factor N(5)-glutamine methyltransferase [Candidatus Krumholzibacteriota bacterium]
MYLFLKEIYERFREEGFEDPLEETLLLADIISGGRLRAASPGFLEKAGLDLGKLLAMRKEGTPLEYILGQSPFMGELFLCAPGALIPREETELLTKKCIGFIEKMQEEKADITVAEIGTGSGNIAVALALNTKNTLILASDITEEAIAVASKNVERFGVGEKVKLFTGDLFSAFEGEGLEGKADLVVCNPPYIPTGSLEKLGSKVIDHEPVEALDAGAYGIDIFTRLIAGAPAFLRPGGMLAFEIGAGQDKIIARLFRKNGLYEDIASYDDGKDIRVFSAVKSGPRI